MPTISVIVPVYNTQVYLNRCVDSILAQTFNDFELLLINDGSTDNSGTICDNYAKIDARIHVIHQKNQGQAVARNNALDIASGEFICFVDSDDYVHPLFLEILHNNINESNAMVSICNFKHTEANNEYNAISKEFQIHNGYKYVVSGLLGTSKNSIWILCDKLFRKSCWNNIRLPKGRIFEDNAIVYKILLKCNTIVTTNDILYYYFTNPSSTTQQQVTEKHLDWLDILTEISIFFDKSNDKEVALLYLNKFIYDSTKMYKSLCINTNSILKKNQYRNRIIKLSKLLKIDFPSQFYTYSYFYETFYPFRAHLYYLLKSVFKKIQR